MSTEDTQVATHFSRKRPILGICLKRYSVKNGHATRLDTYVDIPTEITLPHFIQDDNMNADGPIYGNFKLSLQSMVCHRGKSVDSGHYIAIVRGTSAGAPPANADRSDSNPGRYWMRFDDLAAERVTLVDIEQALKDESPYLLFYQILPIGEDPAVANLRNKSPSSASSDETQVLDAAGISSKLSALSNRTSTTDGGVFGRPSIEVSAPDSCEFELLGNNGGRQSVVVSDTEEASNIAAQESQKMRARDERESTGSFSFTRRRSRPNKSNPESRPTSQVSDGRIATTFSRLTGRLSKDRLANENLPPEDDEPTEENEPAEQPNEKADSDTDEKGNRGRSKDRRLKGKAKAKSKSVSKEKSGKRLERECTVM